MKFSKRRSFNLILLSIFSLLTYLFYRVNRISLVDSNFLSGWILLILMLFLAAYNGRKKLPFLPFGRSSAWLQLHIYGGLLSVVLFLCHIRFRVPNGRIELLLAILFVIVAGSGVIGILVSKIFARQLSVGGEEILFERIPLFRNNIRREAENLILQSVSEMNTTSIADFYTANLRAFFERPAYFFHHLVGSKEPLRKLTKCIDDNDRYLNESEREIMRDVLALINAKYDLDYHYALQWVLKGWLFIHIPLTFALLFVIILHIILVYIFHGAL